MPVPIVAAVAAGVAAVAGMISQLIAGGQREKAAELARQTFKDVPIPDDIQKLFGDTPVQPDVQQGETRESQIDALRRLSDISQRGGLDSQALAGISEAQGIANQQAQGRTGAIRARLERQGGASNVGGALLQQQAAQSASNAAAQQGLNIQAQAQQRALQALMSKSQLAGQARGQDEALGMSNQKARQARDQFNANLRAAGANAQLNAARLGLDKAAGISGQYNRSGDNAVQMGNDVSRGLADVGNVAVSAADSYSKGQDAEARLKALEDRDYENQYGLDQED